MVDDEIRLRTEARERFIGLWIKSNPDNAALQRSDPARALTDFRDWVRKANLITELAGDDEQIGLIPRRLQIPDAELPEKIVQQPGDVRKPSDGELTSGWRKEPAELKPLGEERDFMQQGRMQNQGLRMEGGADGDSVQPLLADARRSGNEQARAKPPQDERKLRELDSEFEAYGQILEEQNNQLRELKRQRDADVQELQELKSERDAKERRLREMQKQLTDLQNRSVERQGDQVGLQAILNFAETDAKDRKVQEQQALIDSLKRKLASLEQENEKNLAAQRQAFEACSQELQSVREQDQKNLMQAKREHDAYEKRLVENQQTVDEIKGLYASSTELLENLKRAFDPLCKDLTRKEGELESMSIKLKVAENKVAKSLEAQEQLLDSYKEQQRILREENAKRLQDKLSEELSNLSREQKVQELQQKVQDLTDLRDKSLVAYDALKRNRDASEAKIEELLGDMYILKQKLSAAEEEAGLSRQAHTEAVRAYERELTTQRDVDVGLLNQLRDERDEHEKKLQEQAAEIKTLKSLHVACQQRVEEHRVLCETNERKMRTQEHEIDFFKKKIQTAEEDSARRLDKEQKAIAAYQDELRMAREAEERRTEEFRRELDANQRKMEEQTSLYQQLTSLHDEDRREMLELKALADESAQRILKQQQALDSLTEKLAAAEAQGRESLAAQQQAAENYAEQLKHKLAENEKKLDDLKSERGASERRLQMQQAAHEELKTAQEEDKRKLEDLKGLLDADEAKLREQEKQLESMTAALVGADEKSRYSLAVQQKVAESLSEELSVLKERSAADARRFEELAYIRDAHERKLEEQQKELQVLMSQLATTTEGQQTVATKQKELETYVEQLKALCQADEVKLRELQSIRDSHEKKLQEQEEQVEILGLERRRLEEQVKGQNEMLDKVQELKIEHEEDQRKLAEQKKIYEEGEHRLSTQQRDIEAYESQLEEYKVAVFKYEGEIQALEEHLGYYEERAHETLAREEMLMEKDRKIELLQKDLEQQKALRKALEQQLLTEVDDWKRDHEEVGGSNKELEQVDPRQQEALRAQLEEQLAKEIDEWSSWREQLEDDAEEKPESADFVQVLGEGPEQLLLRRLQDEEDRRIMAEAKLDLLIRQVIYLYGGAIERGSIFKMHEVLGAKGVKDSTYQDLQQRIADLQEMVKVQDDEWLALRSPRPSLESPGYQGLQQRISDLQARLKEQEDERLAQQEALGLKEQELAKLMSQHAAEQLHQQELETLLSRKEEETQEFRARQRMRESEDDRQPERVAIHSAENANSDQAADTRDPQQQQRPSVLQAVDKQCEKIKQQLDQHRAAWYQMRAHLMQLESRQSSGEQAQPQPQARRAEGGARLQFLANQVKALSQRDHTFVGLAKKVGALTLAQAIMLYCCLGAERGIIHPLILCVLVILVSLVRARNRSRAKLEP